MCGEIGPLVILCWGKRLLLIIFFISFFVVYGYFHVLITYTFLGSIVCLVVGAYLYLDDEIKEIEGEEFKTILIPQYPLNLYKEEGEDTETNLLEDDVHICTLTDTSEHSSTD